MNSSDKDAVNGASLRMRPASRALILSHDNSALFVRFEFSTGVFWALPGGGKEGNETYEQALVRELTEEVGLEDPHIGPIIWTRKQLVPNFGKYDGQSEQIFLVKVPSRFEPAPSMSWEELRAENVFEIRWWSLTELYEATENSEVKWIPQDLPRLVIDIIENGPPSRPLPIGL